MTDPGTRIMIISKLQIVILTALVLNACDSKTASIQSELKTIEKTAQDPTQTQYVRESASIFSDILSEKKGVLNSKLGRAHWSMVCDRSATAIATYLAFLKALEKQLPDELPSVETYLDMRSKAGNSKIIEKNVGQTQIMMSNSIKNISLYGDSTADAEVEGVLKRLKEGAAPLRPGKKSWNLSTWSIDKVLMSAKEESSHGNLL